MFISTWAGRHGDISQTSQVGIGENHTVEAHADSGYEIDTWYLDGQATSDTGTAFELHDIDRSHSVGATFRPESGGSIQITSPNGDELYARSTRLGITWSWVGEVGDWVSIVLVHNGVAIDTIADSCYNDGSEVHYIPWDQDVSDQYKIRVSSIDNPAISDMSDQPFVVDAELDLPDTIWCSTCADIEAIGSDAAHPADAIYALENDISCDDYDFDPIGPPYFEGTLRGGPGLLDSLAA